MIVLLSVGLVCVLSTLGGFVAGREYGLELAVRRIVRAYERS